MPTTRNPAMNANHAPLQRQELAFRGPPELINAIVAALVEVPRARHPSEPGLVSAWVRLCQEGEEEQPEATSSAPSTVPQVQDLSELVQAAVALRRARDKRAALADFVTARHRVVDALDDPDFTRRWSDDLSQPTVATSSRYVWSRRFADRVLSTKVADEGALRSLDAHPHHLLTSLRSAVDTYAATISLSLGLGRRDKDLLRDAAQKGLWKVAVGVGVWTHARLSGQADECESLRALQTVSEGERSIVAVRESLRGTIEKKEVEHRPPSEK